MIKKAAGYVRVSSKGQVDNESLTTQRRSIKDYAKSKGWELLDIYADEGISGGSTKQRPALLRLLCDAKDGKFNVLIIRDLSRFGRNATELLNNCEDLERAGIQLWSIKEGIDFSGKLGKFFRQILASIAELEREMIRERVMEN